MSRSVRHTRPAYYDYWSKRPGSGNGFGKKVRNITHRRERMLDKKIEREAGQGNG